MKPRLAPLILLVVLAGCASLTRGPYGPAPGAETPASPYVAEPGRDAATIAEMRAAPAPATPELAVGKNPSGDLNRLATQGFVRIGSAHYPGPESSARDEAIRQGQGVGAERVLLYAPAAASNTSAGAEWLAAYYVRFKLPFGATFRDLEPKERASLGSDGGVEIGAVVGGTPASRANLLAGDFILQFNGKPVAGKSAFQNLLKASAGRSVTLTIVRNGETLQRVVRLGSMPAER